MTCRCKCRCHCHRKRKSKKQPKTLLGLVGRELGSIASEAGRAFVSIADDAVNAGAEVTLGKPKNPRR